MSETLSIDGRTYAAAPHKNLLQVCLEQGLDLPYFCWHPALGSVGSCRQCAVTRFEDEQDTQGSLIMACMTPAKAGLRIGLDHPPAQGFRRQVVEWLMLNHPHDCPVCEEGGECHLQDMTVMTGHTYRRNRFPKRSFRNQDLGPFLGHEMNRCITCYRCVRFYRDYAGGDDLQELGIGDRVWFGPSRPGPLQSPFSGNLVEVCPTGVFTDRVFSRHYTRKWDLRSAPSVCVHCAVGCNTRLGARYGELRRITNRHHPEVNGYFLCDRGRYGHGFVQASTRIREPLGRDAEGKLRPIPESEALGPIVEHLRQGRLLGIGSPRASLEANLMLRRLVGPARFFAGMNRADAEIATLAAQLLQSLPAAPAGLTDVERADAVLVLGEDPTRTAPRLALALRQTAARVREEIAAKAGVAPWQELSVRHAAGRVRANLFLSSPLATGLDDLARASVRRTPQDSVRLALAVARRLDPAAHLVAGLSAADQELAERIAEALLEAERPLLVSGYGGGDPRLLQATAAVCRALHSRGRQPHIYLSLPECNSLGLALLQAPPLEQALQRLQEGAADSLLVLENDLLRQLPATQLEPVLERLELLALLEHSRQASVERADLVLPAASFAESDGTLISAEGRAQRYYKVLPPQAPVQASWHWLARLEAMRDDSDPALPGLEEIRTEAAGELPILAGLREATRSDDTPRRIPRATPRYSGRTAAQAQVEIHEPPAPPDPDSSLSFTLEGDGPPRFAPYTWAPGWNSDESLHRFQHEIPGAVESAEPGLRLFDEQPLGELPDYPRPPDAYSPEQQRWLLLPLQEVFGSDELSALSPPVAELIPAAYLTLNPADAQRLGLDPQRPPLLELELQNGNRQTPLALPLQARLNDDWPAGTVGLPLGLPGLTGIRLPTWALIRPRAAAQPPESAA